MSNVIRELAPPTLDLKTYMTYKLIASDRATYRVQRDSVLKKQNLKVSTVLNFIFFCVDQVAMSHLFVAGSASNSARLATHKVVCFRQISALWNCL